MFNECGQWTDRRRRPTYPISSPVSLRLGWAKNSCATVLWNISKNKVLVNNSELAKLTHSCFMQPTCILSKTSYPTVSCFVHVPLHLSSIWHKIIHSSVFKGSRIRSRKDSLDSAIKHVNNLNNYFTLTSLSNVFSSFKNNLLFIYCFCCKIIHMLIERFGNMERSAVFFFSVLCWIILFQLL